MRKYKKPNFRRPPFNQPGEVFGRLTLVKLLGMDWKGFATWRCRCVCGNELDVRQYNLRSGNTTSCGCYQIERCTKHGLYVKGNDLQQEKNAYHNAMARCTDPRDSAYHNYGGRGIEFRFKSFQEFLLHIGRKPSRELSLDRIDNDGHYEPGNVRWISRKQNQLNRRKNTPLRLAYLERVRKRKAS